MDIPALRGAMVQVMADEKAKGAHGCKINTTNYDDKAFVNFVVQQTVVVFYHMRRIKKHATATQTMFRTIDCICAEEA